MSLSLPNSWDQVMPPGTDIYALEAGSFSDEAARRVAGHVADASIRYAEVIGDVWKGIAGGSAGIVPFENANAGVVWPHLHELSTGKWRIVGEIHHPVNMCAGTHPDIALDQASEVCSHPTAIGQSGRWIDERRLSRNPAFRSTVDAVKHVAQHPHLQAVALGTRTAIEDNGLILRAEDVADSPAAQNITRMFIVRDNGHSDIADYRFPHHAAIIRPEEYDGSLADLLSIIKDAAGLSCIQSRSIGHMQYEFFLQMRRRTDIEDPDRHFQNMAETLFDILGADRVRWLGSWGRRFEAPESERIKTVASS